jgi:hypothetical protein
MKCFVFVCLCVCWGGGERLEGGTTHVAAIQGTSPTEPPYPTGPLQGSRVLWWSAVAGPPGMDS